MMMTDWGARMHEADLRARRLVRADQREAKARRWWRRGKHFVTTNALGATDRFQVGRIVEVDGKRWLVKRQGKPIGKWGSIYVYGVRV